MLLEYLGSFFFLRSEVNAVYDALPEWKGEDEDIPEQHWKASYAIRERRQDSKCSMAKAL